jgi:hypothetical protein
LRSELTDATNIALEWVKLSEGLSQGYEAIDGYKLYWDDSGSFELRVTLGSADITSYSETNIVLGDLY